MENSLLDDVSVDMSKDDKSLNQGTGLHKAARAYDFQEIESLIERGYDPNSKDKNGRSAIHVLLTNGFLGHLNEGSMLACLRVLVDNGCDINGVSNDKETALTLAVHNKFEACAKYLVQKGADTTVRCENFKAMHSLASSIAAEMPSVMIEVLNSGIDADFSDAEKPIIELDWRPVLQYSNIGDLSKGGVRKNKYRQRETSFLYSLLDLPVGIRNDYLTHPLVVAYLHKKGGITRRRLWLIQVFLMFFPLAYMGFISYLYFNLCKLDRTVNIKNVTTYETTPEANGDDTCSIDLTIKIWSYFFMIVVLAYGVFELVVLLIIVDFRFLTSWRNWVIRVGIVIMALTLWPGIKPDAVLYKTSWQYPVAALGTFFAWVMFLIQMEFVPQVKVYLEMLVSIVISVLKITLLFLPLLIGFFMGFNLMFFEIENIMNFILMTVDVGSDNYDAMFDNIKDSDQVWFAMIAYVFGFAFIVIIAIVFMNFLLGVSISDIQELKKNAKVMTLSNRVQSSFVLDLIFPSWYNIVTEEDVQNGRWTCQFEPSGNKFPQDIYSRLVAVLKLKHVTKQKADFYKNLHNEESHWNHFDSRISARREIE